MEGQNLPPPPFQGADSQTLSSARVKAAVHWVCVNALSAESSPKLTWDAMGLRAESARNPIALHVKFGDDSALSAFTRTQWTAALRPPSTRCARKSRLIA